MARAAMVSGESSGGDVRHPKAGEKRTTGGRNVELEAEILDLQLRGVGASLSSSSGRVTVGRSAQTVWSFAGLVLLDQVGSAGDDLVGNNDGDGSGAPAEILAGGSEVAKTLSSPDNLELEMRRFESRSKRTKTWLRLLVLIHERTPSHRGRFFTSAWPGSSSWISPTMRSGNSWA